MLEARSGQGDKALALQYSLEALQFSKRNVELHPENFELRRGLAIGLNAVARMVRDHKDPQKQAEALRYAKDAVDVAERLAEDQPSNPQALRGLTFPLNTVGEILRTTDRTSALPWFERSLTIAETYHAMRPDDPDAIRGLAIALFNVARLTDDPDEAMTLARRSLAYDERLVEEDPTNVKAKRGLAISLTSVSYMLTSSGRPCEALEYARRASVVCEKLVEVDRESEQFADRLRHARRLVDKLARDCEDQVLA